MPLEVILQHYLFDQSPIFEGDLPAKPEKSKLIEVLEAKGYMPQDIWYQDSPASCHVILDFMSRMWQILM